MQLTVRAADVSSRCTYSRLWLLADPAMRSLQNAVAKDVLIHKRIGRLLRHATCMTAGVIVKSGSQDIHTSAI
jgi:hypothetical protein